MRPYIEKHLQELREKNQDEDLIMKQHKLYFITWLKDLNLPVGDTEEEKMIHLLTSSPHSLVKSWQAYDINGCTFYTKAKDNRSPCQHSGVRVVRVKYLGYRGLSVTAQNSGYDWFPSVGNDWGTIHPISDKTPLLQTEVVGPPA
jgi:hypothetical protein